MSSSYGGEERALRGNAENRQSKLGRVSQHTAGLGLIEVRVTMPGTAQNGDEVEKTTRPTTPGQRRGQQRKQQRTSNISTKNASENGTNTDTHQHHLTSTTPIYRPHTPAPLPPPYLSLCPAVARQKPGWGCERTPPPRGAFPPHHHHLPPPPPAR